VVLIQVLHLAAQVGIVDHCFGFGVFCQVAVLQRSAALLPCIFFIKLGYGQGWLQRVGVGAEMGRNNDVKWICCILVGANAHIVPPFPVHSSRAKPPNTKTEHHDFRSSQRVLLDLRGRKRQAARTGHYFV
jgi:hypothetical protein